MSRSAQVILNELCDHSLLSREKETALYRASRVVCHTEEEKKARLHARDALIRHNMKYVVKIARAFSCDPEVILLLVDVGVLGLMRAIDGAADGTDNNLFDPKQARLRTFAHPWIWNNIHLHLFRESMCISGPWQPFRRKCNGIDKKKEYEFLFQPSLSLDAPVSDDMSLTFAEVFADESNLTSPEDALDKQKITEAVTWALEHLDPRERLIIRERILCDEDEKKILAELADELGISRERVRQLEQRALPKLKRILLTHHRSLMRGVGLC